MGTKILNSNELTNEAYHADTTHVSGSKLAIIYNTCTARALLEENKPSKALSFGTLSHTMMLEPSIFSSLYVRDIEVSEDMLVTASDLTSWLKDQSRKGLSGKSKAELIEMVIDTATTAGIAVPPIYDLLKEAHSKTHSDKTIVSPDEYDMVIKMRQSLEVNGLYKDLQGGDTELSIFTELHGVKVKVRVDYIDKYKGIVRDYKTTQSCDPRQFYYNSLNYGYLLKMALQQAVCEQVFDRKFDMYLLAQEKVYPYIAIDFKLTEKHLEIGREQLKIALQQYKTHLDTGTYSLYGNGLAQQELWLPDNMITN